MKIPLFPFIASSVCSVSMVHAQLQELPASAEEIFELSPFEVQSNSDPSYGVAQTLAGNRLRTDVKDVGAAMTILTKTFFDDLAASDLMEVADFVPGVEALTTQESGPDDNTGTYRPQRFRIRGLFTESQARNYFTSIAGQMPPSDGYNLERVTFSKGANSILFGSANPAGIINSTTLKAVLDDTFSEVGMRFDNYGSRRLEVHHNQPLISDRLAARFAYLIQDNEGWRDPEWSKKERFYGAIRFQMTENTTIHGNYEIWDHSRNVPYWGPYRNMFGAWEDAGKPLVPWTGVNPTAPGIRNYGGANLPAAIYGSAGQTDLVPSWRVHAISMFNRESVINHNQGQVPFDFAGYRNLAGDLRVDERWGTVADISLEHKFTESLSMQLGAFKQEQEQNLWISWSANQVTVDANSTLPDGSPNPDAGRYFLDGQVMQLRDFDFEDTALRWTTSYDLDLRESSELLGRHQFAVMVEDREGATGQNIGQLQNTDPNRINPDYLAGANKLRPVVYIDLDGSVASEGPMPDARSMAGYLSQFDDVTATWENVRAGISSISDQQSYLAAVQSQFMNDRLVTTLGYRIDTQDIYSISAANWTRDNRGFWLNSRDLQVEHELVPDASGVEEDTYSAGAVYHLLENKGALDYLSLTYNTSTNFQPSSPTPNYQGDLRSFSTGETIDYGIKFGMYEGRLEGSLNFYDSGQKNARLSGIGYVTNQFNAIYEGLEEVTGDLAWLDRVLDNQTQNGDTFDNDAEGVAFQMIYNPVSNWRIYLSADRSKTVKSNIAPSATQYIAANAGSLRASQGSTILPDGRTVGEVLDFIDNEHARTLGQEGTQPMNQSKYKFNVNTNYSFREGALKGFNVGGYLRWEDKRVIGWARDENNDIIPNLPFYGDDHFATGLSFGFRTEIADGKIEWITSVNIRNLLDDTDLMPIRAEEDATTADAPLVYAWNFQEPRSMILSTKFKF